MVTFGVSAPLPVLYQLQGEQKQAEAQMDTNSLQRALTTKQVVSDVDTAYAAYVGAQKLVVRMEKGEPESKVRSILESAKVALDITRLQYEKGAASLSDFLLALQTYIATKVEYLSLIHIFRLASLPREGCERSSSYTSISSAAASTYPDSLLFSKASSADFITATLRCSSSNAVRVCSNT